MSLLLLRRRRRKKRKGEGSEEAKERCYILLMTLPHCGSQCRAANDSEKLASRTRRVCVRVCVCVCVRARVLTTMDI